MSKSRIVILSIILTIFAILICSCKSGSDAGKKDRYYTVYSNGMVFEHCTRDVFGSNGSVKSFFTQDGRILVVGGSFLYLEEK